MGGEVGGHVGEGAEEGSRGMALDAGNEEGTGMFVIGLGDGVGYGDATGLGGAGFGDLD